MSKTTPTNTAHHEAGHLLLAIHFADVLGSMPSAATVVRDGDSNGSVSVPWLSGAPNRCSIGQLEAACAVLCAGFVGREAADAAQVATPAEDLGASGDAERVAHLLEEHREVVPQSEHGALLERAVRRARGFLAEREPLVQLVAGELDRLGTFDEAAIAGVALALRAFDAGQESAHDAVLRQLRGESAEADRRARRTRGLAMVEAARR